MKKPSLVRKIVARANAGGKKQVAAVKKAIGDFRPGKATGYYRSLTVRETAQNIKNLFKKK